jgi:hypothetical protein
MCNCGTNEEKSLIKTAFSKVRKTGATINNLWKQSSTKIEEKKIKKSGDYVFLVKK